MPATTTSDAGAAAAVVSVSPSFQLHLEQSAAHAAPACLQYTLKYRDLYAPPALRGRGTEQCCDPSICLSVFCLGLAHPPKVVHFMAAAAAEHWKSNPLAEVAAETATKPSLAPFRKHSLGGCTVDMPN